MLNIPFGPALGSYCDKLSRRQMLRVGSTGLFGGLTLPQLLHGQDASPTSRPAKATSCIFIFLEGGPPQQDMWDPKPEAPSEIRGPFQTIPTKTPGVFFSEHCRECAKISDKFTVVRSHSHADNGHSTGYYYVMTGRKPTFPDGENPIPTNDVFPSLGAFVGKELGSNGRVPAYINMPHPMSAGGPGFLGAEYAPFVIEADPSQPDFEVKDLGRVNGLSNRRVELRQQLLAGLEQERQRIGRAAAMSTYYSKAYNLISSPEARKAFDIQSEPTPIRESYGMTQIGQCALLGRRMVEAGCRFVGIDAPGWDVHFNCFPSLSGDLIPPTDRAFAALIKDLEQRGMLDTTLVVMMGEMGRTPRINAQAGRDHWSMAQCVLFAGGGVKPGQIIGATDAQAAAPTNDPVSIPDLLRTIHTLMGIDSSKEYPDPLGRPFPLVNGGKLIPGLIA
ncbi:DUF1501 domain-containing protein [Schlesneria paludicola]|uniref:DUF1501 domain-containing protein n=1 Tax=Schlesneria paludicola TaxID=360056 RepID=UPI00029AB323|nr:DUF1501 domain-containing protein [Schlesneria paludicola]